MKHDIQELHFLGEVINGNETFRDVLRQCITQEIDNQIVSELKKQLNNEPV